jgi:hypothetical protein
MTNEPTGIYIPTLPADVLHFDAQSYSVAIPDDWVELERRRDWREVERIIKLNQSTKKQGE